MRQPTLTPPLLPKAVLALLLAVLATGISDAAAHQAKDEALPPPPLKTRVIAPSAHGPWLLRIDNPGDEVVRLAADIRLLRLTVTAPAAKPRARARTVVCDGPKLFGMKSFPYERELLLKPGESFVEQFDPRLFCFGKKAAALVPGALVKIRFGWPENKRRRRMRAAPFVADAAKRPRKFSPQRELVAPTMLLSHSRPVRFGPHKPGKGGDGEAAQKDKAQGAASDGTSSGAAGGKSAPAVGGKAAAQPVSMRSDTSEPAPQGPLIEPPPEGMPSPEQAPAHGPAGAEQDPPPVSAEEMSRHKPRDKRKRPHEADDDALGARLTLTADHYADARRPSDIQLSVQAHNTGDRPLFVALRSRQLSFLIEGPDGLVRCTAQSPGHNIPRDLFRQLHHGKHIHMNVRLMEVCPPHTFDRPGLYRVRPKLHLRHNGREYGLNALTGVVTVRDPGTPGGTHKLSDDLTLVRIKRGRAPFYNRRATGVPTQVLAKP